MGLGRERVGTGETNGAPRLPVTCDFKHQPRSRVHLRYPYGPVCLSAVNAHLQGTAKWIELNQTANSCASVQFAFPSVVAVSCNVFKCKLRSTYHEAAAINF